MQAAALEAMEAEEAKHAAEMQSLRTQHAEEVVFYKERNRSLEASLTSLRKQQATVHTHALCSCVADVFVPGTFNLMLLPCASFRRGHLADIPPL